MGRRSFTPEQIVAKLRQIEVLMSSGKGVGQVARKLGVSEQTYYRWRREYGGLKVDQAKRLKELERENTELKKMLAESLLKNRVLEAVCEKKL